MHLLFNSHTCTAIFITTHTTLCDTHMYMYIVLVIYYIMCFIGVSFCVHSRVWLLKRYHTSCYLYEIIMVLMCACVCTYVHACAYICIYIICDMYMPLYGVYIAHTYVHVCMYINCIWYDLLHSFYSTKFLL